MNDETRALRLSIGTIQDAGGTLATVGRPPLVLQLEAAEGVGLCKAHRSSIGEVDCRAIWTLTEAGNALLKQKEVFVRRSQSTGSVNHGWQITLTSSDTAGDEVRAFALLEGIRARVQAAHPDCHVWKVDGLVSLHSWTLRAVQPAEALASFPNGPIHRKAIAALARTMKAEYEAIRWIEAAPMQEPADHHPQGPPDGV